MQNFHKEEWYIIVQMYNCLNDKVMNVFLHIKVIEILTQVGNCNPSNYEPVLIQLRRSVLELLGTLL